MQALFNLLATLGLTALAILFAAGLLASNWWHNCIQAPRNHMRVKEWRESVREVILG